MLSFLKRDILVKQEVGNVAHPSLSINKHSIRGSYSDANQIFKAICSTIENKPGSCSRQTIGFDFLKEIMPHHANDAAVSVEAKT